MLKLSGSTLTRVFNKQLHTMHLQVVHYKRNMLLTYTVLAIRREHVARHALTPEASRQVHTAGVLPTVIKLVLTFVIVWREKYKHCTHQSQWGGVSLPLSDSYVPPTACCSSILRPPKPLSSDVGNGGQNHSMLLETWHLTFPEVLNGRNSWGLQSWNRGEEEDAGPVGRFR